MFELSPTASNAGGRSFLDPEQLRLEQRFDDGRAIHRDERAATSPAQLVDLTSHELLARSALAFDEHREVSGGDPLDPRPQRLHDGCGSNERRNRGRGPDSSCHATARDFQDQSAELRDGRQRIEIVFVEATRADRRTPRAPPARGYPMSERRGRSSRSYESESRAAPDTAPALPAVALIEDRVPAVPVARTSTSRSSSPTCAVSAVPSATSSCLSPRKCASALDDRPTVGALNDKACTNRHLTHRRPPPPTRHNAALSATKLDAIRTRALSTCLKAVNPSTRAHFSITQAPNVCARVRIARTPRQSLEFSAGSGYPSTSVSTEASNASAVR